MIELLPLSIGIGLAISLLFTELFGLAAGGMVVPGYIALHLTRPLGVALTLGFVFLAFGIVHAVSPICINRQGLVETVCGLLTASAVVRLILVLTVGTELGT